MQQVSIESVVTTGFARVDGTFRHPFLEMHIHPKMHHPVRSNLTMVDWVKSLGTSQWDPLTRSWRVYGLGSLDPEAVLREAGIELRWDERPAEMASLQSIAELARPIAKLAADGRTVLVRHRLLGAPKAIELVGVGAVHDRESGLLRMHVGDVVKRDAHGALIPRPNVHWTDDAIEAALRLYEHQPVDEGLSELAAWMGAALNIDSVHPDDLKLIGTLPAFDRELFAFQKAGAYAVAAGRTCLFDEPGVGKTFQSLAAARILDARRLLIVCPPLLTTNWAREAAIAGFPEAVVFRTGRKEPQLPDVGVAIISDSTLAARPETARRVAEWRCDVMIVDEAHRLKTIGSARSEAVLTVGMSAKHAPIVITGTPIFAAPHELVPLLELSRFLCPVFGGRSQFLEDFCRQDRLGNWKAKKAALPRLKSMLRREVWVRRRKVDVLPQLPPKRRRDLVLDVPLTEYRRAHKECISKVQAWLTWFENFHGRPPTAEDREEYAKKVGFELISQMRRAAALVKVKPAIELMLEHVRSTGFQEEGGKREYMRPLIVWAHHLDVIHALYEALPAELGQAAVIYGNTSDRERDAIVAQFQEGRIPVLIAGITKAGVGITLTRSSDAIFVETDWTPGIVKQAEDRTNRIGAVNPSQYTTLVARGTLDELIQRILLSKTEVIDAVLDSSDGGVAVLAKADTRALKEIVDALIEEAVRTHRTTAA